MENVKELMGWKKLAPHLWKTPEGYAVDLQLGAKRYRLVFIKRPDAEAFILKKRLEYQQIKHLGMSACRSYLGFDDFIERYYQLYGKRQVNAAYSLRYRLNKFKEYFQATKIGLISKESIEEYIQTKLATGYLPGSVNKYLGDLRAAFKWGVENGYLAFNVLTQIKRLKVPVGRVRWLTHEEADRLMSAAMELNDAELADIIFVGLNTGFRKANLVRLEWGHISDEATTALQTKSNRPYDVPLTEGLKELYARRAQTKTGPLVLSSKNFGTRFQTAARKAGLYPSVAEFKRNPALAKDPNLVTPHVLRHTFASWCLQDGVPIYTVSKWMGHASVEVTAKVYGHLSREHHAKEILKVSMPSGLDKVSTSRMSKIIPFNPIHDEKQQRFEGSFSIPDHLTVGTPSNLDAKIKQIKPQNEEIR